MENGGPQSIFMRAKNSDDPMPISRSTSSGTVPSRSTSSGTSSDEESESPDFHLTTHVLLVLVHVRVIACAIYCPHHAQFSDTTPSMTGLQQFDGNSNRRP